MGEHLSIDVVKDQSLALANHISIEPMNSSSRIIHAELYLDRPLQHAHTDY
jgi:hypothetical protein